MARRFLNENETSRKQIKTGIPGVSLKWAKRKNTYILYAIITLSYSNIVAGAVSRKMSMYVGTGQTLTVDKLKDSLTKAYSFRQYIEKAYADKLVHVLDRVCLKFFNDLLEFKTAGWEVSCNPTIPPVQLFSLPDTINVEEIYNSLFDEAG